METTPDEVLTPAQHSAVLEHLKATGDIITRSQAAALGVSTPGLRRLVVDKVLRRVCRGAYVGGRAWEQADRDDREVLRTRAVATAWPDGVSVSHSSAARLWRIPLLVASGTRVHGARRLPGQHRRTPHYTIHTGYPRARSHALLGLSVVEPAYAVLGVAELHGLDATVVAGDGALHAGILTMDDLHRAIRDCRHHPSRRVLQAAVALMDAACESPGETLTRLLLGRLGYDVESQVVISDSDDFVARVDFRVRGTRVVIEFDGMHKYAQDALVKEKRRDTRLARLGHVVVRLLWRDLGDPDRVRGLVETALRQARALAAAG